MKFYKDLEAERERIQSCIQKYGWTSDHNLDWFLDAVMSEEYKPVFVGFDDGSGLLTHKSNNEWRIWSDPLSQPSDAAQKIYEFCGEALKEVEKVWCDDVSEKIHPELKKKGDIKLNEIYYSLQWPVLNMAKYDPSLPGGHFKEMRNARNKFYRERDVQIINATDRDKNDLHKIVDSWTKEVIRRGRGDIYDLKYHKTIDNNFRGFSSARILIVDGKPVGINAGYEVINNKKRFAGVVGLHDYSIPDLGTILWLEDLEWVKSNGYKEFDMQGSEDEGLKFKLSFGASVERKTDTFSITKIA